MHELSMKQVRRLMIGAQGLSGPVPKRPTKNAMKRIIRQIGALQIDSISVVERSHHIVLWSRLGNHPPEWLHELHGQDRELFEYWAHACAFVPIELFPCFRPKMLEYPSNGSQRTREWVEENQELLDHVMAFIRQNGAVSTRSFEPPEGAERAEAWAWYGNKPTNIALVSLWTAGKLMVARREGFQRIYDLTERVLPEWDDANIPSVEEAHYQLAARALEALGVTTVRWLPDYFRMSWGHQSTEQSEAYRLLCRLEEEGSAVRVRIKGIDEPAFASTSLLEKRFRPSRTTLLSPFDNLIWDRSRTLSVFDFELRLEAYTPPDKRIYGYFSLPILHRDALVGRLDPKVDRRRKTFIVRSLHFEPEFTPDDRFYSEFSAALHDFMLFNGAEDITFEEQVDGSARQEIERRISAITERDGQ